MSGSERCTSCGAKVPAETGECAYCGTGLPGAAGDTAPAASPAVEKVAPFDALAERPSFDKWMRWRPDAPRRRRRSDAAPSRP